jgi:excisionase family DNA binding protein
MGEIVPKTPDLKDMVSVDEAAKLGGCSFEDIEDLIEHGKLSSREFEGRRVLDRQEVERLKEETDLLQEDIGDNS